jgi:ribosomal protein S18 acetylase RimI-like enzyme
MQTVPVLTVRPAVASDGPRLVALDRATWSEAASPVPRWPEDTDFFGHRAPEDTLVAERGGLLVGYASLVRPTPAASNRHVLQIDGLAVDPAGQRQGVGRRLIEAAVTEATRRGARRLTLRVLGGNTGARALYASCGFIVEGVLREEFLLAGRYVDDVLMARTLSGGTQQVASSDCSAWDSAGVTDRA